MLFPVFLAGVLAVASCGCSPHADLVEQFLASDQASNYSASILIEAFLDVPALVARYNYPIEVHHVVTSDGYILQMHRIPHGRDNHVRGDRPVILIMHGLLSSSADFLLLGPENALAYLLAEEGFDVWLGNARGNYYSRRHLTLDPDLDIDFWKFSWDEIGFYDLPAMIDFVLNATRKGYLHYAGHSQGGTSFLVLNSLRPEYGNKIASFHGLAPAAFFIYNENSQYKALAPYQGILEGVLFAAGDGEFLPNLNSTTTLSLEACSDKSFLLPLCHTLLFLVDSFTNINTTLLPVIIGHTPAGASIRQVTHYGQCINTGEFRRYDYGFFGNLVAYSRTTPPEYDLSNITVPAYLYYGPADIIVNFKDLFYLSTFLNTKLVYIIPNGSFGHLDFIWGANVKSALYDDLIRTLKEAVRVYG